MLRMVVDELELSLRVAAYDHELHVQDEPGPRARIVRVHLPVPVVAPGRMRVLGLLRVRESLRLHLQPSSLQDLPVAS